MSRVAARSLATAEDAPGASLAGQMKRYLNVRGAGLCARRPPLRGLALDSALSPTGRGRAFRTAVHLRFKVARGLEGP